jgi:hypothetical protein
MTIHEGIPTASIEYPIPSTLYGISYQKTYGSNSGLYLFFIYE